MNVRLLGDSILDAQWCLRQAGLESPDRAQGKTSREREPSWPPNGSTNGAAPLEDNFPISTVTVWHEVVDRICLPFLTTRINKVHMGPKMVYPYVHPYDWWLPMAITWYHRHGQAHLSLRQAPALVRAPANHAIRGGRKPPARCCRWWFLDLPMHSLSTSILSKMKG